MSVHDLDFSREPERYELDEAPRYRFRLPRRDFLQISGAGLFVVLAAGPLVAQRRRRRMPQEIAAWLHVGGEGAVTVYTGKAEVGQNIRTSLSQVVAEELRVPLDRVEVVMGDTDRVPYDMGTFGSRTTPVMAPQLRRVAARARETLRDLAAKEWGTDAAKLSVDDGNVVDAAGGRARSFGELTAGKKLVATVDPAEARAPEDWTIAGKSPPKVGAAALVTGAHRYASDVTRPGMLHGKVVRPERFGASLVSADLAEANALDGVVAVRDGDFVGVAAPNEQLAERAAKTVRAEWRAESAPAIGDLFAYLKDNASRGGGGRRGRGRRSSRRGSIADGLSQADHVLSREFEVAYIAHAPLEPRAAVAEWDDGGKLTVWTGTQRPFGVRSELARAFGIGEDKVRVIVPDTGSGYGGKHSGECAIEAARLARTAKKPVKLVWTREEEFTWAYFRPAGLIEVKAGVTNDGQITAWEHDNYNSGGASIAPLYAIPNVRCEFHRSRSPLRQGSYRALAATANHFARESMVDELAEKVGIEPLAFRRKNLQDARLRAVLDAAAARFGWTRPRAKGRGAGIAGGFEKGGYAATCAEVSVTGGTVRVERLVTAFECGAVLHPEHLKNQIEGCAIQGLGGALYEAIELKDGRIANPRFSQYRVPRFSDTPQVEAVLVDRKDLPSQGAGETPIVTIAPAVASAISQASGKRPRSLPMLG